MRDVTEPSSRYVTTGLIEMVNLYLRTEDTFGALVIETIIPAISHMREHLQLSLGMVLSKDLLESNDIPHQVNIADLEACQRFLAFIKTEYVETSHL